MLILFLRLKLCISKQSELNEIISTENNIPNYILGYISNHNMFTRFCYVENQLI